MPLPFFRPSLRWASFNFRPAGIARTALLVLACLAVSTLAYAQNPGDPLFCQPQEGTTFLIVNGGAGVFTADADCYNNNLANDTDTTIATSQGGTMTRTAGTGNYVYTPPTAGFTGLDTFPITVTTVWNSAGGTGSAGGAARPGGPATMTITLNVIPATTTLTVAGVATLVPVPAGSVSGCTALGNAGTGPAPGAVLGCITGIGVGTSGHVVHPSHGTVAVNGNTLQYTPTAGYTGTDTFTYEALGVNTDGPSALNSGDVTVNVTVTVPFTPAPPTVLLALFGLAGLAMFEFWRRARRPAAQ
jgi:Bacterial Ig domain